MADSIAYQLARTGPIVVVNDSEQLSSRAALQARAPDVPAADLAQALMTLEDGPYRLILDPKRFEQDYRKRLASEDPGQPWQQNVFRLRDFGIPDFGLIDSPARNGDALIFHAADTVTGLPYRVTVTLGTESDPEFEPLPLTPASDASPPVPPEMTRAAVGPVKDEDPVMDTGGPEDYEEEE